MTAHEKAVEVIRILSEQHKILIVAADKENAAKAVMNLMQCQKLTIDSAVEILKVGFPRPNIKRGELTAIIEKTKVQVAPKFKKDSWRKPYKFHK